jgi:anti-anti-sigma factor
MTPLLQRVPTDPPARAAAVQPDFQPGVEVPTVTVCPVLPGAVVLAVRGDVDSCTSPLLRDRLLEHLRPACPQLVVDLTEVGFFGAAGLTVLVTVRQAAEAAGIRLCLVAGRRAVLLPLTITGLDDVFDICPDIAHALLRLRDVAVQIMGGSLDVDDLRA